MGCARALRAAALAALVSMGWAADARAGDPDLGEFLLQHGRTALSKGEYDDALTKLHKAREEDPSLIEATYWIAVVCERKDDPEKAVAEYRRFRDGADAAERDGTLEKSVAKLLKKAVSRLKKLDAGNLQIDELQTDFADGLCLSARAVAESNPDVAARILRVACAAAPDHNDAKIMLAELRAGSSPLPAAFDCVDEWQDVIQSSLFGRNPGWTYADNRKDLTVEGGQGSIALSGARYKSSGSYAYSTDVRLDKITDTGRTTSTGLIFGLADDKGFGAMLWHDEKKDDRIGLTAVSLNPSKERVIKMIKMVEWKPGGHHRLSVLVRGDRIEVWLDNERVIEHKVSGRDDLSGTLGLSYQNANFTFRRLKVGRVPEGAK